MGEAVNERASPDPDKVEIQEARGFVILVRASVRVGDDPDHRLTNAEPALTSLVTPLIAPPSCGPKPTTDVPPALRLVRRPTAGLSACA